MENPIDVKSRITRSLSELNAFIFDKRIIDIENVERILSNAGVSGLLSKAVMGNIVVYHIDLGKFKRKCLYERCSIEPITSREACIRKCLEEVEKNLVKTIILAIENIPSYDSEEGGKRGE